MSTILNNALDVNFDVLKEALAYACGLDPEDGEISGQWARRAARALTQATAYCWRIHPWPEVCDVYTTLTLAASVRPDDRLLAPGWELLKVYAEDPREAFENEEEPDAEEVPFRIDAGGRILLQGDPATPHYYVRLAVPVFDATDWKTTVNYYEGRVVYTAPGVSYREGECWKALTGSLAALPPLYNHWGHSSQIVQGDYYRAHGVLWLATANGAQGDDTYPVTGAEWQDYFNASHHFWAPQRLPEFLREAVLAGAEAWMLRTADGQLSASSAMEKAADRVLQNLVLKRWGAQRQNRRGRILTVS